MTRRYTGTLTANCTISLTLSNDQDIELLLTQGGVGSYTVSWSTVDVWFTNNGSAPVLKTAVGAADRMAFWRTGGVTYGSHTGDTGVTGATGATGPAGITWRRAWSNTTTYAINDVVSLNGSSYIALQASSGANVQEPDLAPTYWSVLAQSGGSGGASGGGSTETVDTFVRANVTPLSSDTGGAFTYAQVSGFTGTLAISSNLCIQNEHTNVDAFYRAATVLSSTDHHAQTTFGALAFSGNAPSFESYVCCRMASSAATFYFAELAGGSTAASFNVAIKKCVAGTITQLVAGATFSALPTVGDTLKLTVLGTQLTAYYNGVSQCTIADSSITTGSQCGLGTTQHLAGTTASYSEFRFGT